MKTLNFDRIDISKGIDINKTSKSVYLSLFVFFKQGVSFNHMDAIDVTLNNGYEP